MKNSFAFGHLWLMLAIILYLGRVSDWSSADGTVQYSLFDVGEHLSKSTYHMIIGACVSVAVICFVIAVRGCKRDQCIDSE